MKHHPVVIITSNPDGMSRAVKHLEVEGYEVKVLDSLGANLIDFFSAISSTDPEVFSGIDDTPKSDGVDSEIPADTKDTDNTDAVDDPNIDVPSMDDPNTDLEPSDSTDPSAEVVFKGTVNDESIDIHEVPGDEIILHPKSISGSGDKVKFQLQESIEMNLWEEKSEDDELHEVSVHLVIPDLDFDKTVKIKVSEMVMEPPVILMGEDWFAANSTTEKK